MKSADFAVILVTPSSAQAPWVLWEAGAVYGSGIASSDRDARKVRPLVFKLSDSQVPPPLAGLQCVEGDDAASMTSFLEDLINEFGEKVGLPQALSYQKKVGKEIERYLARVNLALADSPLLPDEALIQEWCERLDQLEEDGRMSEVGQLHDWLNLTFGRGPGGLPPALDLRIHRRLASCYRAAKQPNEAVQQFDLALKFAPRDIFLLRGQGLACLDAGDLTAVNRVVERIRVLDPKAFVRNAECATLLGKLQRKQGKLSAAAETYKIALDNNPRSYYLADVLGQALLELNRKDEACEAYRQAMEILDRLAERNLWMYATLVTASLVLGHVERAMGHLADIAALNPKPSPDDLDRIEEGFERVHKALNLDPALLARGRALLRGGE